MKSLFLRIYLGALAFLAVAFFSVAYFANDAIYSVILERQSRTLQEVVTAGLADKPVTAWAREVDLYDALVPGYILTLLNADSLDAVQQQALSAGGGGPVLSENRFGETDLYSVIPLGQGWVMKIEEDQGEEEFDDDWIDMSLIFLVLFSTLGFALFLLVRKLTRPIAHLTDVATRFGEGDWQVRADRNLPGPLATMARGFNDMADQLNTTLHEQQVLIGAIPHELRSPLARIRFALDLTRDRDSVESLRQDIEHIDGYVDDMQHAVDEIVELNRLQGVGDVARQSVNLWDIVEPLVAEQRFEAPQLSITLVGDRGLVVFANAGLVRRAVHNVLRNAQRHARTGITVHLDAQDGGAVILVEDDGEGIADDRLEEVFLPFATLDESRGRSRSGIGLGLSIVRLIMQKHHGSVHALPVAAGARLRLQFPEC